LLEALNEIQSLCLFGAAVEVELEDEASDFDFAKLD
jgi:hypothetical protein